jgi:hypothetical protein
MVTWSIFIDSVSQRNGLATPAASQLECLAAQARGPFRQQQRSRRRPQPGRHGGGCGSGDRWILPLHSTGPRRWAAVCSSGAASSLPEYSIGSPRSGFTEGSPVGHLHRSSEPHTDAAVSGTASSSGIGSGSSRGGLRRRKVVSAAAAAAGHVHSAAAGPVPSANAAGCSTTGSSGMGSGSGRSVGHRRVVAAAAAVTAGYFHRAASGPVWALPCANATGSHTTDGSHRCREIHFLRGPGRAHCDGTEPAATAGSQSVAP